MTATVSRIAICLVLALPLAAQLPAGFPSSGQLNDAQATAMMQAIAAQAQSQAAPALTQAQLQLLLQYMTKASANSSANAVQAQMLAQAMAQSQAAAPGAMMSAAQAQSLSRMFAGQPGIAGTPPGQQFQQSMPGMQMPGMQAAPTQTQFTALAPKKAGMIRIGVMEPKAQLTQNGQGANVAEPLRNLMVHYLSGPMLEVVSISAVLAQQAQAEAAQKECDFVLVSSLTQKLDSGKLSMLKKAAPMASMIPMVGMAGGMAGAIGAAAGSAAASTAANVASGVKAKADVTLQYQLVVPANGTVVIGNTLTAKAKTDGEDVVTPLVEQADSAIFAAITKK